MPGSLGWDQCVNKKSTHRVAAISPSPSLTTAGQGKKTKGASEAMHGHQLCARIGWFLVFPFFFVFYYYFSG
jgi:hypothetical protein